MHKKQQRLASLEREGIARRRSRANFHRLNHRKMKMKLKGKRELSREKQRRCNCEMERERKQEKRGGVKTTFPRGSFG